MPPSAKFLDMLQQMRQIHVKKNADYSGDNDCFYNFKFAAELVKLFSNPTDQVFASLIGIKLARLTVLLSSEAKPQNESIEDSFIDCANYMVLWGACRAKPTVEELDRILNGEDKQPANPVHGIKYGIDEFAGAPTGYGQNDECGAAIENRNQNVDRPEQTVLEYRNTQLYMAGWRCNFALRVWSHPMGAQLTFDDARNLPADEFRDYISINNNG